MSFYKVYASGSTNLSGVCHSRFNVWFSKIGFVVSHFVLILY